MLTIDDIRGQFIRNRPVDMSGKHITNSEINSFGYRTSEFSDINWKESVVVFGCSNVFGIGLDIQDTVSSQLEKLIGRPVINMGIPAGSLRATLHNQVSLHEIENSPYAIVNNWTSTYRTVGWRDGQDFPIHIGPWVLDPNIVQSADREPFRQYFTSEIVQEENRIRNALLVKRTAGILWKETRHVELTMFPDTQELFRVPMISYDDFASDRAHPGPRTISKVAKFIADRLE